jgi:hypothetical protein
VLTKLHRQYPEGVSAEAPDSHERVLLVLNRNFNRIDSGYDVLIKIFFWQVNSHLKQ